MGQLHYYKLGQPLLQNIAAITNWGKTYYKLGQVLQIRTIITNWGITFVNICKRFYIELRKLGQCRKKCVMVSLSLPHSHNRFKVPWKQCLNFWSQRWLRPRRNLGRSLIPYVLWMLKKLFTQGHTKFKRFILKFERLPEFLIFQSSLFHSDIVEGKNEFLK